MLIYYVYAYIRKSDGTPYYIGKGKDKRAYRKHTSVSVPKDKSNIVFLETCLSEIGAFALERRYILWWGRKDLDTGILLNQTEGGEGASGAIVSQTTRDKQSIARKGKPGNAQTSESKAKIGKANKGAVRPKLSAPRRARPPITQETRDKMSATRAAKWNDTEYRSKQLAAKDELLNTPEFQQHMKTLANHRWHTHT